MDATVDTGLMCLAMLARFYNLPVNVDQIRHKFAKPSQLFDELDLLRAAKHLGLKAKAISRDCTHLKSTLLPVIVEKKAGGYVVLAKTAEDKVLIQDPLSPRPQILTKNELLELCSNRILLFTQRTGWFKEQVQFGLRWFVPALAKYRRLLGEVLLASFFIQLLALVTPLFFQVVIDKVLVHQALTTLDVLAIGLLGVSLFEVLLTGLRTYLFSHTTSRVDVTLGAKLFEHLLALPLSYFESRRVGNTVARVHELDTIRQFITGSALTLVIDLFFTVVFFAVMYYYSPILTAIVAGSLPFYVLLSIIITPLLRERLHEKFHRGSENQAFLVETVSGIGTVKASAVEPLFQRQWETQLAGYVSATFKANNLSNIATQLIGLINKIVVVLTLWFGAKAVILGELSVGQLIAFNMLAGRVSGPILRIAQLWQDFQQAGISIQRLGDILNTPIEPVNPSQTTMPQIKGQVSFEQVTFRYRPDRPEVLRNVSLQVSAGQVIGIVGRSGCGKSTLTKLIQRLYLPELGRVYIDGMDISMLDPSWLRRQIGVVLQENILFNRSVRENIALNDPGIALEHIVHAAQLAGAHDFILELPEGYDSLIGEQGGSLSGGQRQRIAIARALITNPRILIFDEATSALDYESESIIHNNMRQICVGRTVFIIAHRLSAVRYANAIIVIDKGQIVEQGNHETLLANRKYYASLYAYQQ